MSGFVGRAQIGKRCVGNAGNAGNQGGVVTDWHQCDIKMAKAARSRNSDAENTGKSFRRDGVLPALHRQRAELNEN